MRRHAWVLGFLSTLTATGVAHASEQRAYANTPASMVRIVTLDVGPGQSITVETRSLSAGCDTVLHLWDPAMGMEVASSDDDGPVPFASRFTHINGTSSTRSYLLIGRAASNGTAGVADIYLNDVLHVWRANFAGTFFEPPADGTRAFEYETAPLPGGFRDTVMLALSATGRLVAFDDDGGVGRMSRLVPAPGMVTDIVVGTRLGTSRVNFYVNDPWTDGADDGDGLGAALEAELGTCNSRATSNPFCTSTFNASDTDRDGIRDDDEVFGIQGETDATSEYLSAWGANPRHRDVFLEVDYSAAFGTVTPMTGADIAQAQAFFDAAPAGTIRNPDGLPGVSLHADIGVTPTNSAQNTLFGSWGGANSVPAAQAIYQTAPDSFRRPTRAGIFRYALLTPGGGGQAWMPGDRFGWGGSAQNRSVGTLVHELGHNLNLAHEGHPSWGSANCKPNYDSIMSYTGFGHGFSLGLNTAVIDPSNLVEGAGFGPGRNPTYLTNSAFAFAVQGDAVDWNRDGTFHASPAVRAGATWATWSSCGALGMNPQALRTGGTTANFLPVAGSTPVLVRRLSNLYAFYVGADQKVYYRHGGIGTSPANGSCPGGDELGTACMTWGPEQLVPTVAGAKSVSAVVWIDGRSVVVAYQRADNDEIWYKRALGNDSALNLTVWTADRSVTTPAITTQVEPELKIFRGLPGTLGSDIVIGLFYRRKTDGGYAWATLSSPAAAAFLDRGSVIDDTGAPIAGALSPTLTAINGGGAWQQCGVFTDPNRVMRFYCYDANANAWTNLSSSAFGSFGQNVITAAAKPGLAFHIERTAGGQMLQDAGYGRLFLANNTGRFADMFTSDLLSSSRLANPATRFALVGKLVNEWHRLQKDTGVALYEDPIVGALKGIQVQDVYVTYDAAGNPVGVGGPPASVDFLPLADGTFSSQLKDGNDFSVMERGICLGLKGQGYCGAPSTVASGL